MGDPSDPKHVLKLSYKNYLGAVIVVVLDVVGLRVSHLGIVSCDLGIGGPSVVSCLFGPYDGSRVCFRRMLDMLTSRHWGWPRCHCGC